MTPLEFNIYSNALIRITELILSPDFNEIRYGKASFCTVPISTFNTAKGGVSNDWVTFDRDLQKFVTIEYLKFVDGYSKRLSIKIPEFLFDDLYE